MSKAEKEAGTEFKLERYKYILQQLHSLNENHHKYLSLYQTLVTAVPGAGIGPIIIRRSIRGGPKGKVEERNLPPSFKDLEP